MTFWESRTDFKSWETCLFNISRFLMSKHFFIAKTGFALLYKSVVVVILLHSWIVLGLWLYAHLPWVPETSFLRGNCVFLNRSLFPLRQEKPRSGVMLFKLGQLWQSRRFAVSGRTLTSIISMEFYGPRIYLLRFPAVFIFVTNINVTIFSDYLN